MTDAETQVKSVVFQTSVASVALGVLLSPIPLADELLLGPIYGVMAARIGRVHGLGLTEVPWSPVGKAIAAGLVARAAANVAFAWIPGVAAVANAVSAAALTRMLGGYVDTACRGGAVQVTEAVA
jgi:uncharacterized protein (DUF697 family)